MPKHSSHNDLPASVGLVKEVRSELVARITSVDLKLASVDVNVASLDAKIDSVDAKVASLDAKIDSVDAKFYSLDAKIDSVEKRLESKIEQVLVAVHRTQTLMEEQRSENRIVLDGLQNVIQRQDRMETELVELRGDIRAIRKLHNA